MSYQNHSFNVRSSLEFHGEEKKPLTLIAWQTFELKKKTNETSKRTKGQLFPANEFRIFLEDKNFFCIGVIWLTIWNDHHKIFAEQIGSDLLNIHVVVVATRHFHFTIFIFIRFDIVGSSESIDCSIQSNQKQFQNATSEPENRCDNSSFTTQISSFLFFYLFIIKYISSWYIKCLQSSGEGWRYGLYVCTYV